MPGKDEQYSKPVEKEQPLYYVLYKTIMRQKFGPKK